MALIRPASHADVPALVELLGQLFALEEDFQVDRRLQRQGLELMLDNPGGVILVADIDGQAAAMCSGQLLISTAEGGPVVLVEDLVVDAGLRRRGLGRALLNAVVDWAADRGATRVQLLADRHNRPALEFYDQMGWKATQLICLRQRPSP